MKSEKGFTLVELMVVVIILGILVAIAIPIFNNVTGDAQKKACAANERTLEGAVGMYLAANGGKMPSNLNELVTGGFIEAVPTCPVDSNASYTLNSNGTVKCNH
jgi:prepilin-type N-terminal cleavage/methylation domain-containing protein